MEKIVKGLFRFQEDVFPEHEDDFRRLSTGQNPDVLLVTCSDSRIDPALIMQAKPGELFICRNVGNIIPSHGDINGGVSATIEYAVMALGVKNIIICGHSDCGAMKGVIYPQLVAKLPNVARWLHYADAVGNILEANYAHLDGPALLRAAIEENIVVQLDNLETHPSVAARLRKGDLRLHGWVYDIETGNVTAWDAQQKRFVALRDVFVPTAAAVIQPGP